jgi:hypothetical protein
MAAGFGGSSAQASNFASPATGFGFGGAIGAGAPQSAPDADADGPQQSVLRKTLKYDIPPHVPPFCLNASFTFDFFGRAKRSSSGASRA